MRSRFAPSLALLLALTYPVYAAPPVADAGETQFAECVGGVAAFTLDGTGSTDPDGDTLTYTWTGPFGTADGPTVDVEVPLGNNEITLEVDDGIGGISQATTNLIVVDTNPPVVGVAMTPSLLIPPDGSFRNVEAEVVVSDVCNLGTSFTLHSITSNEPETTIVVNAEYGTPDTAFILGALLTTQGPEARTYTIFYEGVDAQGNTATGSGEVLVAKEGILDVTPSKLIYRHSPGDNGPAPQTIQVTSIAAGSYFTVESDQWWVRVSEKEGRTSSSLDVTVDPSELPPGSHGARLTVTSEYGVSRTVRVQLYKTDSPEVFAMPEALSFEHDVSVKPSGAKAQSAPQTRSVFVGALHTQAPFTVTTDVPWLAATTSGKTPARITVSAAADGLEVGEYTGNVRVLPTAGDVSSITIPVSLSVVASRGIQTPPFLVNAATMERRPLAPGSLVTGFWDNPFAAVATAPGLPLPETLSGVSATIDGKPVRFSYVSRRQFNAQLPMDLWAGVSHMQLFYDGEPVGTVPVQILPASPGIFHSNGNALAVNPDGTLNGPNNPAPRNSGVALFVTGQGHTNPIVADGAAAPSSPFATPVHPLHLVIDGETKQPLFAGLAPGLTGLLQVNAPTHGLAPGAHVVVISIHSTPSNGVTIYVR
jgi:uncharacterized protein (TIGR03437 family)